VRAHLVHKPDARHLANHLDGRPLAQVLDGHGVARLIVKLGAGLAVDAHAHLDLEHRGVLGVLVVQQLAVKLRDQLLGHRLAKPLLRVLGGHVDHVLVQGLDLLLEVGDLGVDVGGAEGDVHAVGLDVPAGGVLVGGDAKGHDHGRGLDLEAVLALGAQAQVDDLAALFVLLQGAKRDGLGVEGGAENDLGRHGCRVTVSVSWLD
jgi:hypothetical protein